MSQLKSPIILPLTVVLLAAGGYAYYWAQARQAATLARITALDTCLAASNQRRARDTRNTFLSITTTVSRNHNPAADVAVLMMAQHIQHRTATLIDTLQQLRQNWAAGRQLVAQPALVAQLIRYRAFAQRYGASELWSIPLPKPGVDWLPAIEAPAEQSAVVLATLTRIETQVRQLATVALESQAMKVGSGCGFDKMGAVAIPASETVAPGGIYRARLLLAVGGGSGLRLQFSADGNEISYDAATGRAAVNFKVPTARPNQPDTVRAQWHGRVRLRGALANTVLEATVPYFIVKSIPR